MNNDGKDFVNNGKDEYRYLIYKGIIPNASAVLIRRSVYEKWEVLMKNKRYLGDWMLWVKILLISDIAFVAKLNYYRKHKGSLTSN